MLLKHANKERDKGKKIKINSNIFYPCFLSYKCTLIISMNIVGTSLIKNTNQICEVAWQSG